MKTGSKLCAKLSGILVTAFLASGVYAAGEAAGPDNDAPRPRSNEPEPRNETLAQKIKAANISGPVREVAQMYDKGIDASVIQSFVENSTVAYIPRADEIIYLNERGVPSAIITTMIQHGARVREQVATAQAAAVAAQPSPASVATYAATPPPVPPVYPAVSPTYAYPAYADYSYSYGYPYYSSVGIYAPFRFGFGFPRPYFYSRPFFGGSHFSHFSNFGHPHAGVSVGFHHHR
jgi:hypothetical protein